MCIQLSEEKLLKDLIALFILKTTLINPFDIKMTALMIIDVYSKGCDWNENYSNVVKQKLINEFSELQ